MASAVAIGTIDAAAGYLGERPHLAALIVPEQGPPVAIGRLPFHPHAVRVEAA
jgi:hypothetical protein